MEENDDVDGDEEQRHHGHRTSRRHIFERNHLFFSAHLGGTPGNLWIAARDASSNCLGVNAGLDRAAVRRKLSISARLAILPRAPDAVQLIAAAALLNSSITCKGHA